MRAHRYGFETVADNIWGVVPSRRVGGYDARELVEDAIEIAGYPPLTPEEQCDLLAIASDAIHLDTAEAIQQ